MIKIIPLRHCDINKVIKMIEYVTPGLSPGMIGDQIFVPAPFNLIHAILPLNLKFLQESYVAVEDDEPLGLISLAPDGCTKARWKINRLVLGMNAYDVGKQLVDYVVNKYGGAGVEIFLAIINENSPEAIALFKNACSFRNSSKINVWEYENGSSIETSSIPETLRKITKEDAQKVFELEAESILPQFRTHLVKKPEDFQFGNKSKLISKIKGQQISRYVLDNPKNNTIEGVISMVTADKANFWVDITLSLAYKDYYEELINFSVNTLKSRSANAKIYMGVKDYQQTGKYMTEVLKGHNFKQCGNFQLLVKDYWRPAGLYKHRKVPAIIFPDMTSPACNITRFIAES